MNYWSNFSLEERRDKLRNFHAGRDKFLSEKGESYDIWCAYLSQIQKKRFENIDFELEKERGRKISVSRLNSTIQTKEERKRKIQMVYNTGKHNALWERYSNERQGSNNPAAKKIMWNGLLYTKLQFEKDIGDINDPTILKKSSVKIVIVKYYSQRRKKSMKY